MRRVTKELGIPLIADEIQCGIGRSGKFFAFEHADIEPDVILCSKAIGGSQPLSVVVYNKALDVWKPGAHAGTFRGNQLAMKAGTVVLKTVSQADFLADVRKKGDFLKEKLEALKKEFSIIGDVRGKGLMLGVEFVNPRAQKDSLGAYPPDGTLSAAVQAECFKNHLVMERGGRNGAVMRCLCALNVSLEEIETMFDIFSGAVKSVQKAFEAG